MADHPTLDPENWADLRQNAHEALDLALDHMAGRSGAPVWQGPTRRVRAAFTDALPGEGTEIRAIADRIASDILPHDVGNTHPAFFGWVHGSGTPAGLVPEMFGAAMNANLGGRDHAANLVEHQVIGWCREMFGFPGDAGGLIVSGTSVATLIALKAARDKAAGLHLRDTGLKRHDGEFVGYASIEAHSCIARAFDILGLGRDALRAIPVDANFRMDTKILRAMIEADRAASRHPFAVIGSAGTVNVGAIDPLAELADIAQENDLWFHVDGAFGASVVLNAALGPLVRGIERADSLAFDFHKWMHVNYDAGFVLMRDAEDQRRAFAERPDYLLGAERGLAAGNPWFCEYGPELSRGFRALKVWFHLLHFGTHRIGAMIGRNCEQARLLRDRVVAHPQLALLAPVGLNITCFRFDPGRTSDADLDALNAEIVIQLQERGLAAPSTTRIDGRLAIRVNLTNHRTRDRDLEDLVENVLSIGGELTAGG